MNRDDWGGRIPFLLNTEELATLWHFPIEATANAPLIQKTPAKKYKPPANLVSEDASSNIDNLKEELLLGDFSKQKLKNNSENNSDNQNSYKQEQEKIIEDDTKGSPPANLPLG